MIEINKKWALGGDNMNIILYHKSIGKKATWVADGYYATLHGALTNLVNQEVRDTKLASLEILTVKLDEIYDLIKQIPNITIGEIKEEPSIENGEDT